MLSSHQLVRNTALDSGNQEVVSFIRYVVAVEHRNHIHSLRIFSTSLVSWLHESCTFSEKILTCLLFLLSFNVVQLIVFCVKIPI
jgi:hypothetical protein